jgi:AraC-like DNA-binding protein
MLYGSSLPAATWRQLQHWSQQASPPLAQRAYFVLWSAQGWSVPALARVFHCCRRTVQRWLHAFLQDGLPGLLGRPQGQPISAGSTRDSATISNQVTSAARWVSVVPLSVPEIRRIFNRLTLTTPASPDQFCHWSIYRRYKHAQPLPQAWCSAAGL